MRSSTFDKADFPVRYHEAIRGARNFAVGCLGVTGSLAVGLSIAAVYWNGPPVAAAIALALFALGLIGSVLSVRETTRYVQIIPYFESPVGSIDTFLHGQALARQFRPLEELAARIGSPPLSTYGFNDDLAGETLVWHAATDGLATVRSLIAASESDPDLLPDTVSARADLKRMEHALQRAADQQIRFCLLVRTGNSTSGHEWSVRRGTAF